MWKTFIYRFLGEDRGNALMETAAAIPILATILLGGFETVQFVMLSERLSRSSMTIADSISRYQGSANVSSDIVPSISAAGTIMSPFTFNGRGTVIASFIYNVSTTLSGPGRVYWQHKYPSTSTKMSRIANAGSLIPGTKLPSTTFLLPGQGMVVVEVFYDFDPIFNDVIFSPQELYYRTFAVPRKGICINTVPAASFNC